MYGMYYCVTNFSILFFWSAVRSMAYRATVDVPARFRNSKAVGAMFGLTPAKHQSD